MKHSTLKHVEQLRLFPDSEELPINPSTPLIVLPENKQSKRINHRKNRVRSLFLNFQYICFVTRKAKWRPAVYRVCKM